MIAAMLHDVTSGAPGRLAQFGKVLVPTNEPVMFPGAFDLDAALTPQPLPLHAQWALADAASAVSNLVAATDRLLFLGVVAVLIFAALSARSAQRKRALEGT